MDNKASLSEAKQALLSKWVKGKTWTQERIPGRPAGIENLPLSYSQQRLWFIDQFEPGNAFYNIPIAVRLVGHLNVTALAGTLSEIVRRHESLRTVFKTIDGNPVQVITESQELPIPVIDLSELPHGEGHAKAQWIVQDEAQTAFDLSRGPLIRAKLIRLDDSEHIFVLTMHHIVSDGWSMGVLIREVAALYSAYAQEQVSPLPELVIQYADYAHWQRQWLQGDALAQQLNYWSTQLGGAPTLLTLPTDRPRPAVQSYRGASVGFVLSAETTSRLNIHSKEAESTLFMNLMAAYSILLSRYAGQNDICIGTPIANRARSELEDLIGFFVNTLVIRTLVDDKDSYANHLKQVRSTILDAYAHQVVPFEQLVEVLKPERHTSHSPVFQVMLVLQNAPTESLKLPDLTLQRIDGASSSAKFDLTLTIIEGKQKLRGAFEYNTDLFDHATIERMAEHFAQLLDAIVVRSESTIEALPMLSEAELQSLESWSAPTASYPQEKAIHQQFEEQATRTPEAIAVVYEDKSLSYDELNSKANQLAHYLRAQGIATDDLVGLCVERSLDMLVGILGILKAGGAYVPLDPAYPSERLSYMLADAQPKLVLIQQSLQDRLELGSTPSLSLDSQWQQVAQHATSNPSNTTSPNNLAYVIYTSGSTGKPKGAQLEHRNVMRLFDATAAQFGFDERDSWTMFHSYAFDFSVWEIWGALLHGGKLVIVPQETARSPEQFHALLVKEQITILNQTPSAFQQLIAADAAVTTAKSDALTLRKVIFGGEALNTAALVPWFDKHGDQQPQLINMYGITETTVHVTYQALQANPDESINPRSVGRPIADLGAYILDASQNLAPIGVAGELYITGAGLARGYLNRPELTAERFVPDPYGTTAGERMYKSGDLGRYLADGNIEYLGRIDTQVKIRGFRIELGEIEAALTALPAVRETIVLAREDIPGDKRLVAYLVGEEGSTAELDVATLRSDLLQTLPDYMVPAHFVQLEHFPLTANGKIDRRALPAPDMTRSEEGYVAPRTETEQKLADIWADVLKRDKVGIHDNFFALGGHSLLVINLIEKMRKAGLSADVRALFAAPTIASLAVAVGQGGNEIVVPPNRIAAGSTSITPDMLSLVTLTAEELERITDTIPDGAANIQDIYPLAPLQEGILFHHMLNQEGDTYLLPTLIEFDQRDNLDDFVQALQQVVDRHDILRTAILWEGLPEPVQVVCRQTPITIDELRFDAAQGDIAAQLSERYHPRRYRLDVRQAPLLHGAAAQKEDGRWLLQIVAHHLISDHTTLELVIEEIQTILLGQQQQLPAPQPFRNFVAQARLGVSQAEHEEFFSTMLSDVVEPTIPFGLLDVQGDARNIEESHREVESELAKRIRQQARKLGVSAASLMHLAWAQVLSRVSGQQDVVFGTVLFGRMQGGAGADRVLGMFINTLPIRISIREKGISQSIEETHATLTQLLRHEHASLAMAQRRSGVAAPTPLFSALLNYRHSKHPANEVETTNEVESTKKLNGPRVLDGHEFTNYPFYMAVDDLGDGFKLVVQVSAPASVLTSAAKMCDYMHTALEHLIEAAETAPRNAINLLDVLPQDERRQLLIEWNDTAATYPKTQAIHQLIEAQAAIKPDAIAAEFDDLRLSYSELNARANRLAHHLRAQGIGPDKLVAICVERSLDMLVGLLAINKAGGAYIPLDPAYPKDRLNYMLDDAKPAVLLTQASLAGSLASGDASIFCIDRDWNQFEQYDSANLSSTVVADNLAYVIYTSGSTGKPKGVGVTQGNLVNFLHGMQKAPGMQEQDILLSVTSLSFDIAGLELYLPLITGAKLVLCSRETAADPQQLSALLQNKQVTMMQATPSTWRMLNEYGWPTLEKPLTILCGGEALSAELLQQLHRNTPTVWNMYGPTETTIWSAAKMLDVAAKKVTLGGPIANTGLYILDTALNLVPAGVTGELHISGNGVARGYLNRPELSAEKFIPHPYGDVAGERLYKTGDLARYLPDGSIEYLGRIDNQVKIRGFRIELGEIESALNSLQGIKEAVVVAREDAPGDKRLVAYAVLEQNVQKHAGTQADGTEETEQETGFSLFCSDSATDAEQDKYALYLESARFADQHGFEAVWIPEQHFQEICGLYPNPSGFNAALATITEKVQLRAGNVVLPLHNPIRVAEEWSVIDNLSNGRVGVALDAGWHSRDFALKPENYQTRKQTMSEGIDMLQALWKGDSLNSRDGANSDATIQIFPKPIQDELPLWVTAAGDPEAFVLAGKLGLNVLTPLLGQTIAELSGQITLYRETRRQHGYDPEAGRVTLMVHTYIGEDLGQTVETARGPFMKYVRSHPALLSSLVKSLNIGIDQTSEQELENVVTAAFERYSRTASLIGTPQSCLPVMNELVGIGVDEFACLVDWMEPKEALAALPHLVQLRELARAQGPTPEKLKKKLRASLPDYMVPAAIMMLDALPLTPNGKIDRKALPAPDMTKRATGYVAPTTPTEGKLAEIWATVLKLDKVGIYDNFFEIGGHSLLVTQLSARIVEHFNRQLSLRALFEAVTVAEMAALIDAELRKTHQPVQQAITKIPRTLRRTKVQGAELVMDKMAGSE